MHKQKFASINNNSDKNRIFKMAKRLKRDNVDVVGEKCVRNDDEKVTLMSIYHHFRYQHVVWSHAM